MFGGVATLDDRVVLVLDVAEILNHATAGPAPAELPAGPDAD